ncbi:hypothetical protein CLAFUR4_00059 [Fulvia fulva]|nr:hypothetical protein CLAFUR4_00059 [Fulvia fulva]KAK4636729.1 hypothetical protein CLAFUR0_00058 [Fulvia fulva]
MLKTAQASMRSRCCRSKLELNVSMGMTDSVILAILPAHRVLLKGTNVQGYASVASDEGQSDRYEPLRLKSEPTKIHSHSTDAGYYDPPAAKKQSK